MAVRLKIVSLFLLFVMLLMPGLLQATVILQYHHISNDTPKATSLSPELFKAHMLYLHHQEFNVISMAELVKALKTGQPLPKKSVVITFDDGYQNIYENALPILKEFEYPFTVFINTQPIVQKLPQFMTTKQLKELVKNGATLGNHSATHAHLIRKLQTDQGVESDQAYVKRIKDEILSVETFIHEQFNQDLKIFAYPFGEWNSALKQLVSKLGYIAFSQNSGAVGSGVELTSIPRFPFGGQYGDLEDFKLKVNTLPMPLESTQSYAESGELLTDIVLADGVTRPKLKLTLKQDFAKLDVQCYLSGQGRLKKTVEGQSLLFEPNKPLNAGRSKYNCTAKSPQQGGYYWYSVVWIKKLPNGKWYSE
ncbi:polysaccharide deacetylase family protein [Aliikangiella sp. IMCC44653]